MGKKYVSKRLQKRNIRFQGYMSTNQINDNEEKLTERPAQAAAAATTTTAKKLKKSRAQLRNRSISRTELGVEDEDEDAPIIDDDESSPPELSFDNVNIIIGMNVILNLVNHLSCPSCHRVGEMSQKVTQRRGLLYHITFSCTCSFETSITNSKQLTHSSTKRLDELNMMACTAANIAGIKRTGMTTILGMLNILPPVQIENWKKYHKIYSNSLSVVKDESLGMAGKTFFLISSYR
jgi:hypothetical protein